MGHNIDFCELLGLPEKIICPRCRRETHSGFDEYDIDCGSPEASKNNGVIVLNCYCEICEFEFETKIKSELVIEDFKE